ncbi:hypothetical protein MFIFM68171_02525 [Madurella fahalii]|uniref:Uncharacterized protein n=1 Tax=Madurella fahalii TaxID=1157608 RepID=A0ABQ0G413_9PEZI
MYAVDHKPDGTPFLRIENDPSLWRNFSSTNLGIQTSFCQSCSLLMAEISHKSDSEDDDINDKPVQHLDGKVASLADSATNCRLCRFIVGQIWPSEVRGAFGNHTYSVRIGVTESTFTVELPSLNLRQFGPPHMYSGHTKPFA